MHACLRPASFAVRGRGEEASGGCDPGCDVDLEVDSRPRLLALRVPGSESIEEGRGRSFEGRGALHCP